ncbi:hypothetical protein GCM10010172_16580 [Paractinoplanes ferrugineus]|uniref:Uncharacterized protein n=1 Tax=Paractinoplanes ferrugineus TaxID=113564 RepID=A0A919IYN8_9ACTN|nr:hypothetical protein [Actinoplanes ferrugineus]GIE10222.1 hypothetical protein Afe05nite_20620 [Actinoplanes ferrugineus]
MRISQHVRRVAIGGAVTLAACVGAQPAHAAVGQSVRTTPSFNGSVYAIAYRGDTVYVGGSFTSTTVNGRTVSRDRLAAFDAGTGALRDWAPRADDTVRALAISGSSVYAAGEFARVSGRARDSLARIDAGSGAVGDFQHAVEGSPRALAVGDGRLYLAGTISRVDQQRRDRLAAFSLDSGELDDGWTPAADNTVYSLAYRDAKVYLGGAFHKAGDQQARLRLAAVDASSGDLDDSFRPSAPAVVYSIAADDSGVYAAMGGQGGRAASFSKTGRTRWTRFFDGDAQAIAVLNGTAYVGGHFDRACTTSSLGAHGACTQGSESRVKLAAVNGDGSLSGWAPQANGVTGVRAIGIDRQRGTVAVGGDFTTIGGQAQRRFASFG